MLGLPEQHFPLSWKAGNKIGLLKDDENELICVKPTGLRLSRLRLRRPQEVPRLRHGRMPERLSHRPGGGRRGRERNQHRNVIPPPKKLNEIIHRTLDFFFRTRRHTCCTAHHYTPSLVIYIPSHYCCSSFHHWILFLKSRN